MRDWKNIKYIACLFNRICGWSADDHGLDARRRKFISNIRQLLKDDETIVIRSLIDNKVDAYKLEYSK